MFVLSGFWSKKNVTYLLNRVEPFAVLFSIFWALSNVLANTCRHRSTPVHCTVSISLYGKC